MHHYAIALREVEPRQRQSILNGVFLERREVRVGHSLPLNSQHHHDVRSGYGIVYAVRNDKGARGIPGNARVVGGYQGARAGYANVRAELGEQVHVGSSDPAVHDVADDCDTQAFDPFLMASNSEGVEQCLRRMLVSAVASIYDRSIQ